MTVLESNVESYSHETQQNDHWRGLNQRTSGDALFEDVVLPFLDENPPRASQLEQFQNGDYEIALVPRGNHRRRMGTTLRSSTTMDRILLLPLTWRELLDRVRKALNRPNPGNQTMILRLGDVRVDFSTMEISRSEKPIALTAQQFKLLKFFTQSPKRVISREELLNTVWGYNDYPSTRTVDNHICALRQKLELNPARPIHFLTVRRVGYKFIP